MLQDDNEVIDPTFTPISNTNAMALWAFVAIGLPGIILGSFWVNGFLGFSL
jgi:hypothetical protein